MKAPEFLPYDVLQVSRDGGLTWLDFSTLRDASDFGSAVRIVDTEGRCSGFTGAFRVVRGGCKEVTYPVPVPELPVWQAFPCVGGWSIGTSSSAPVAKVYAASEVDVIKAAPELLRHLRALVQACENNVDPALYGPADEAAAFLRAARLA